MQQLLQKSVTGTAVQIPFARDIMLASMHVAGTAYYEAKTAAGRLRAGQRLALRREPDNVHDGLAIEVLVPEGSKLGYLPRRCNEIPARLMDAGKRLLSGWSRSGVTMRGWRSESRSIWRTIDCVRHALRSRGFVGHGRAPVAVGGVCGGRWTSGLTFRKRWFGSVPIQVGDGGAAMRPGQWSPRKFSDRPVAPAALPSSMRLSRPRHQSTLRMLRLRNQLSGIAVGES